ncbi:MAG: glycoside hydrolase family protein [Anaeromyxobacter sp.]
MLRRLALLAMAAALSLPACRLASKDAGGGERPAPGTKRGVAYDLTSQADADALGPQVSWYYNWSTHPGAALTGAEFVPMVWGKIAAADVPAIEAAIPAGAKYLLGFNEPNFKTGQANLSPAEAADLWPLLEKIADDRGLLLVAPAVNYCGGACWETDPVAWLDAFFAACAARGGCRVDHVAVHAYVCYGGALGWYLDRFQKYGKPLWLTEFSCADEASRKGSTKGQADYMAEAVPLLEGRADVFRYAWFIGRSDPVDPAWPVDLLGADGKLTWLGQAYVGFPGTP